MKKEDDIELEFTEPMAGDTAAAEAGTTEAAAEAGDAAKDEMAAEAAKEVSADKGETAAQAAKKNSADKKDSADKKAKKAPADKKASGAKEDSAAKEEEEEASLKEEVAEVKEQTKKALRKIRDNVREEDPKLTPTMTLRTILGGDFLTAEMVRHQIWLFVLIVLFAIVYVAFRYQCQQDMIAIDKMEKELLDAKYKALSSSSTLTEKCRESHVLQALKQNRDSLLHISDQPPYIIYIP